MSIWQLRFTKSNILGLKSESSEHRVDRGHFVDVVCHDESNRSDTFPHTLLTQRPSPKFPVSLQKQVKNVFIEYAPTDESNRDPPRRQKQPIRHLWLRLYSYTVHASFVHDEGWARGDVVGAVCHQARGRQRRTRDDRWHLWHQEVLLQVTGSGSFVGFSLTVQLMFRNCFNVFCRCWQMKTFSGTE